MKIDIIYISKHRTNEKVARMIAQTVGKKTTLARAN
jgi:flavodoxin